MPQSWHCWWKINSVGPFQASWQEGSRGVDEGVLQCDAVQPLVVRGWEAASSAGAKCKGVFFAFARLFSPCLVVSLSVVRTLKMIDVRACSLALASCFISHSQVREQHSEKQLTDLYGAVHLLRMFSKYGRSESTFISFIPPVKISLLVEPTWPKRPKLVLHSASHRLQMWRVKTQIVGKFRGDIGPIR